MKSNCYESCPPYLLFFLTFFSLFARIITAVTPAAFPSDWASENTWSTGSIPASGDLVLVPESNAVVVRSQVYPVVSPTLIIQVNGVLNFNPSGKLNLSALSMLQLLVGGKIQPKNTSSSQLVTIGGITKFNGANNGPVIGPAFADAWSGESIAGQMYSGFNPWLLPVRLTAFTALSASEGINLHWQTATEENLSHFIVERSYDGGRAWIPCGEVQAKGQLSTYRFIDHASFAGTVSYRLQSKDNGGRSSYSSTILVSLKATTALSIRQDASIISATISAEVVEKLLLQLISYTGQPISRIPYRKGQTAYTIPKNGLPKGLYFLVVQNDREIIANQKLLVQ